jgi:signal transduction histidine kinase
LLIVQENERRHIARELHDDLVQRLAVLQISLARIRRDLAPTAAEVGSELLRLEEQTGMLSNDVRRLSHQLHPTILDDLGLCAALESVVEEFQIGQNQEFTFRCEGVPEKISADMATTIYRIAQEALRNIAKHAFGPGALSLIREGQALRLTISDAGPGFDLPASYRGCLGILSMKERAQLVGGQFSMTSNASGSTTVDVLIPLPEAY